MGTEKGDTVPPACAGEASSDADGPLDWQRPASGYRRYLLVTNGLFWLALAAISSLALGIAMADGRARLVGLLAPIVIGGMVTAYLLTAAGRRAHALGERALFYRSGLWWRRETAIPHSRIQHVARAQGPIERLFGLASLQVYTAGAAQADLTIPGLATATTRRLEEVLLVQAETPRAAASIPTVEAPQ